MKKFLKIILLSFILCISLPMIACDYDTTSSTDTVPPADTGSSNVDENLPTEEPEDNDTETITPIPPDNEDNSGDSSIGTDDGQQTPETPAQPSIETIADEVAGIIDDYLYPMSSVFNLSYELKTTINTSEISITANFIDYDETMCLPLSELLMTCDDNIKTQITKMNLLYESYVDGTSLVFNVALL